MSTPIASAGLILVCRWAGIVFLTSPTVHIIGEVSFLMETVTSSITGGVTRARSALTLRIIIIMTIRQRRTWTLPGCASEQPSQSEVPLTRDRALRQTQTMPRGGWGCGLG